MPFIKSKFKPDKKLTLNVEITEPNNEDSQSNVSVEEKEDAASIVLSVQFLFKGSNLKSKL